MLSFFKNNPIKSTLIALFLCIATSCSSTSSTPYSDSTSYDSAKNPYMNQNANQNPYGQPVNPQIQQSSPNPYVGSYGLPNQYNGGYQQQPNYGGNYYQQPAPASRYYNNPYAMPSPQNPYYDQDQYYKPPTQYNVDENAASPTFFR